MRPVARRQCVETRRVRLEDIREIVFGHMRVFLRAVRLFKHDTTGLKWLQGQRKARVVLVMSIGQQRPPLARLRVPDEGPPPCRAETHIVIDGRLLHIREEIDLHPIAVAVYASKPFILSPVFRHKINVHVRRHALPQRLEKGIERRAAPVERVFAVHHALEKEGAAAPAILEVGVVRFRGLAKQFRAYALHLRVLARVVLHARR